MTENNSNYYAIQVKTREEDKFLKLFNAWNREAGIRLYFPKRVLDIYKKGKILPSSSPIFPGYIFAEIAGEDDIIRYKPMFRKTEGFYRFLPSNKNIAPLAGRNLEIVLHFIKKVGPVAGKSLVTFDENSRIVVLSGPLMDLEGIIIKVDKRKKRAKIKLDLYEDSFSIDLAFEFLGNKK